MKTSLKIITLSFAWACASFAVSTLANASTCSGLSVQVTVQNEGADTLISLLNASAKLPMTASLIQKDAQNSQVLVKLDAGYAQAMHASAFDAAEAISALSEDASLNVTAISAQVSCSEKPAKN